MKIAALAPLDTEGWFAGQPRWLQEALADAGRWIDLPARQVLYSAGDDPDALFGLGEGTLNILLPLAGNDEQATIHRARPGFWIGDSALLAGATRLVSLEAASDIRVFRVPGAAIRRLVTERPEAWRSFYELSHANVQLSMTLLAEALTLAPRARLARVLLRLADDQGRVDGRQEELARLVGMTRSSLQRALQSLDDAGAIARGYGTILLRDRAALERVGAEA